MPRCPPPILSTPASLIPPVHRPAHDATHLLKAFSSLHHSYPRIILRLQTATFATILGARKLHPGFFFPARHLHWSSPSFAPSARNALPVSKATLLLSTLS